MNWFDEHKNKRFCVLGLGLSGMACVRYLLSQNMITFACDSREFVSSLSDAQSLLGPEHCHMGSWPRELILSMDFLVISPGIDPRDELFIDAQNNGVQIINEIELFHHANACHDVSAKLIGITGSNGKSTVVTLLGDVLNQAGIKTTIGGNLGRPALDLLSDNASCYVIELSSFQLEFCPSIALDVACILNVSEDHLDRYDSYLSYAQTKQHVYHNAKTLVYNLDDELSVPNSTYFSLKDGANLQSFSINQNADWSIDDDLVCFSKKALFSLNDCYLVGLHNWANILAVLAISNGIGADSAEIKSALIQFKGLEHRCQLISKHAGVAWINDSKATNVGATIAAISGLYKEGQHIILIAGGVAKGADLNPLKPYFEHYIEHVITLGQDGSKIADLSDRSSTVKDLKEAVVLAEKLAQANDIVLLSPACASMDMFKNFEHRGNVFKSEVEALS